MIQLVLSLLVALGASNATEVKCDCAHFPWEPKECVEKCTSSFVAQEIKRSDESIALGKLASERANHPDIKALGQQTVDDSSMIRDRLKLLANDLHIEYPPSNPDHTEAVKRFKRFASDEFDVKYLHFEVARARKDADLLGQIIGSDKVDPRVKAVAKDSLSLVQKQLNAATALSAKQ